MRKEIIDSIIANKLIVIVRGVDKDQILPLTEAMYNGGVRLLEITYTSGNSAYDETVASMIQSVCNEFGKDMFIGSGTTLTSSQVELTKQAGGSFIISPNTNSEVIGKTRELGMVSIPAALTPTEIEYAHELGADFVKVFPITNMGPEYVKAVKAPLGNIKLLAVGGVNLNNIETYAKAGVDGFGIGGNIIDKAALASNDFSKITSLAKSYTDLIRGCYE